MLDIPEINRLVHNTASKISDRVDVARVDSRPATDSVGDEALRVTIIFKRGTGGAVTGDDALEMMFQVNRDLENAGETRFPIIDFAAEEEMEQSVEPQF